MVSTKVNQSDVNAYATSSPGSSFIAHHATTVRFIFMNLGLNNFTLQKTS